MLFRTVLVCLGAFWFIPSLHGQMVQHTSGSPVLMDALGDPLPAGAIARLGTLRFKHNPNPNANVGRETPIDGALFSPDGGRIASLKSSIGTIRLWNAGTGTEIDGPWRSSKSRYSAIAFSPDGTLLAAAIEGAIPFNNNKALALRETIVLFDITASPRLKTTISASIRAVRAIAFANKGKTLVAAGEGAVHWLDVASGKKERSWQPLADEEPKVENGIKFIKTFFNNCAFAPDAQSIAVQVAWRSADGIAMSDQEALGFDLAAGKKRWRSTGRGFPYEMSRFAFSADSKRVAIAVGSSEVELRDAETGKLVSNPATNPFSGYNGSAAGLALSSDGRTMALASRDSNICLYDCEQVDSPRLFAARVGKNGPASTVCLRFSPDDNRLLVGVDSAIQIYDVKTLAEVQPWEGHRGWVDHLAFTPDGNRLLTATSSALMIRGFVLNGNVLNFDAGGRGDVEQAAWDVATWKQTRLTSARTAPWPNFGSASLDQSVYVGKTGDDRFAFYDMKSGKLRARMLLPDKQATVEVAFFSPDSKHFVQYVKDSKGEVTERLYAVPSGKLISVLPMVMSGRNPGQMIFAGPLERANNIAFSHDGKLAALFGWGDGLIHVFDVPRGKLRHSLGSKAAAEGGVFVRGGNSDVAFSMDGKLLASWSSQEKTIRLWEVATGTELLQIVPDASLAGTPVAPRSQRRFVLAWSPDGRTLSVGENTIRIFEIATLGVRRELAGHTDGPIHALAFSPSGRLLASGSADTTVLVWDMAGRAAPPKTPDNGALEKSWRALAEDDAARGFAAILDLAATPKETVAWIGERVKPEGALDPKRIEKLIGDLGDNQFTVRQSASAELSQMGERVLPAIDTALAAQPALETHLRLQALRKRLANPVLKSERLRAFRVIEVLERVGTPEAREVLQTLADGATGALLSTQASGALARMGKTW